MPAAHLHWTWQGMVGNTQLVWAPPTSFILDKLERLMPGERLVGAVVHHFADDVKSEIVRVPGMTGPCARRRDRRGPIRANITAVPTEAAE